MSEERTHLSIGEVLALLQDEFPDVTISKIRFLESQGLLVPERTPSGYRKFRDEDIVRLRWILTQQRDHFLPLKVIKERIETGDLGSGPPEGVLPFTRDPGATPEIEDEAGALAAYDGDDDGDGDGDGNARTGDAADPVLEPADGPAEAPTGPTPISYEAPFAEPFTVSPPSVPAPAADPDASAIVPPASSGRGSVVAALLEGPAPAQPARVRRRHPTGHVKGDPTPAPRPADEDDEVADSESFTRAELATRSGLSARSIDELERFGLLTSQRIGGSEFFDEDALVVARLASGFARYGIEPRHLRMYKVSAEREAGLFEQVIMPLLKQRRAAARDEAVEVLEDLAELADDLRAVTVRSALREYLGRA